MAWNMFFLNAPTSTLEWVMLVSTGTMILGYVLSHVARLFSDKVADRILAVTIIPAMAVCGCIAAALWF